MHPARTRQIVVVGGGPAGLAAACAAARGGASVTIAERMPRPASKLRLCGHGRCNVTNGAPVERFPEHYLHGGEFLRQALHVFAPRDLTSLLAGMGLPCEEAPDGRVFPSGGAAGAVADRLAETVRRAGARLATGARAESLRIEDGRVRGIVVRCTGGRTELPADAVVLATGGASYARTGSSGDGYTMAEDAGHSVVEPRPALVPLVTDAALAHALHGLSLRDVAVRFRLGGDRFVESGDVLFTHFGVSGPAVLRRSGRVVDALRAGVRVEAQVDLCPAYAAAELEAQVRGAFRSGGKRAAGNVLRAWMPERMAMAVCGAAGVAAGTQGCRVSAAAAGALCRLMKSFPLPVTGHRSLDEAMVTAGGVDCREVNPRTMASRLAPGLYIAGELLDVDGETGGFNLQAAFSTGWVAGANAAGPHAPAPQPRGREPGGRTTP